MKPLKKAILIALLTTATILIVTTTSKAATVKVTADVLNIRKGPSTQTEVVAMISKDVECELIKEEGDWYQVKYKSYTGYISKQYASIVQSTSNSGNTQNNNNQTNSNSQLNNSQTNENNQANNNQTTQNNTQTNNNNQTSSDNNNQQTSSDEKPQIVYKKLKQNIQAKLLPLIHSSDIGQFKKNEQVILLTQTSLWSYVQSDSISGWVRNTYLEEGKNVSTSGGNSSSSNGSSTSNGEKIAYINETSVNLRKGAGTNYAIIKALTLNTQITIIGEEDGWYQVKAGSNTGYVSKQYVSDSKKVTSRGNEASRVVGATEGQESESIKKQSEAIENNSTVTANKTNNQSTTNKNTTTSNSTTNKPSSTTKGTDVIAYAKQYLGHKYVYGGDGSNGTFDCSGFTMYVFKHFGISLPHGANSQYRSGKGSKISKQSDLKTGDIVFLTDYSTGKGIGHCGIYIGDGNFIHASTTSYTVTISSLNTMYKGRFYAGLRLI